MHKVKEEIDTNKNDEKANVRYDLSGRWKFNKDIEIWIKQVLKKCHLIWHHFTVMLMRKTLIPHRAAVCVECTHSPMSGWVFSRGSGFLPYSKDVRVSERCVWIVPAWLCVGGSGPMVEACPVQSGVPPAALSVRERLLPPWTLSGSQQIGK